ncbi:MAG: lytic transglycosylase domain-containing protein [Parvibaculum sp.]|uniref:lytic transglycosylase domain-containing protein n=1 Tax=Parvibaculum sp. TaxID=2024848 RepID=UPI002849DD0B|nr:lytic transglycosylase domain-containing protein [Parvibaculum sp.]MDR3499287.1 lytic transglycosylase domain-containing protein [Parvibaculum sp.]
MSLVQAVTAHPQIAAALQQASAQTGADFGYLLNTAMRESSLDCSAKSNTSSACGLFQFTEQTWLGTMKKDGAGLGLGQYSDAITQDSKGRYVVADPAARQAILALRNDPQTSALMAGALASDSKSGLEQRLGRSVNSGELYISHFLGVGGASKLISSAEDTPNARADMLFPEAAAANRSIFYDKSGQPKSVSEVYQGLVSKHQGGTPSFQIAPQPVLAAANGNLAAGDGAVADQAAASAAQAQSLAVIAGTVSSAPMVMPTRSFSSNAAVASGVPSSLNRSALQLSPAVVQVLASMDTSSFASSVPASARDEEERKNDRRLLPRNSSALG